MEPTTFEAMYAAYSDDVFRYIRYLTGNEDTAAEITAETFFRAWTGRGRIRLNTAKSYLLSIARNLARDGFRESRRWKSPPAELAAPEGASDSRLDLERTLAALAELSQDYREPLLLTAAGGLTYDEAAAVLRIPVATLKVRIYRARLKLATLLGREEIVKHEHSR